jgi:hypothetical protein
MTYKCIELGENLLLEKRKKGNYFINHMETMKSVLLLPLKLVIAMKFKTIDDSSTNITALKYY